MLDLLMNRRSIRKYKDQEVEKEIIDKIIKVALTSPSGRDRKPWQLIVVTDKEILAKLGKARGNITAPMQGASFGIVVIADSKLTDMWIEDASIMATIIQLTAEFLDLGSCWLQIRKRFTENNDDAEDYVRDALNIPAEYRVECMLAMGYPDEEKPSHSEENLDYDKVHYNGF